MKTMLKVGDILICKKERKSVFAKVLLKGDKHIISELKFHENEIVEIKLSEIGTNYWEYHYNEGVLDIYKYFYIPEEIRKMKLNTILC